MKQVTNEDLNINKQILVHKTEEDILEKYKTKVNSENERNTAATSQNQEKVQDPEQPIVEDNGIQYKTLHVNKDQSLKPDEVIPLVNLENLRFALLNLSNMCCLSATAKNLF